MGNEIFGNSHQSGGSTCRIKTGTYTGDGTTGQAITGVGFQPKYVKIFIYNAFGGVLDSFELIDGFASGFSQRNYGTIGGSTATYQNPNMIISLDADGFSVDDGGIDDHPNKDEVVYLYLAIG